MRIGVDGRTLRDGYPGIGRYLSSLLAALLPQLEGAELVVLHDPTVKSRYDLAALSAQPGVELVPVQLEPRALSQQWKLPQLLRRLSLDVFHAPYYFTAYRGLPCPLVLTLHDLTPIACPGSMPSAAGRLAFRVGAEDAAFLAREFYPVFKESDLVNLPNHHIYLKLMIDGHTSDAFSAVTLPPTTFTVSYRQEIIDRARKLYGTPRREVEERINFRQAGRLPQTNRQESLF